MLCGLGRLDAMQRGAVAFLWESEELSLPDLGRLPITPGTTLHLTFSVQGEQCVSVKDPPCLSSCKYRCFQVCNLCQHSHMEDAWSGVARSLVRKYPSLWNCSSQRYWCWTSVCMEGESTVLESWEFPACFLPKLQTAWIHWRYFLSGYNAPNSFSLANSRWCLEGQRNSVAGM